MKCTARLINWQIGSQRISKDKGFHIYGSSHFWTMLYGKNFHLQFLKTVQLIIQFFWPSLYFCLFILRLFWYGHQDEYLSVQISFKLLTWYKHERFMSNLSSKNFFIQRWTGKPNTLNVRKIQDKLKFYWGHLPFLWRG